MISDRLRPACSYFRGTYHERLRHSHRPHMTAAMTTRTIPIGQAACPMVTKNGGVSGLMPPNELSAVRIPHLLSRVRRAVGALTVRRGSDGDVEIGTTGNHVKFRR